MFYYLAHPLMKIISLKFENNYPGKYRGGNLLTFSSFYLESFDQSQTGYIQRLASQSGSQVGQS